MKKCFLKKLLAGLAAIAILLAAAGCKETTPTQTDDSLKKVLDAGQFVLGLDTEFPPMGFIDETGEIVGFDIDVAREVCRRLGVDLVTKGINWDTKEDDLNNGIIDCIWNGMSVTPGRSGAMNLSDPYMKNELIIVVMGDSKAEGMQDLKGKTVGVQAGSTAQEVLESSDQIPEVTVVLFEDNTSLLKTLEQHGVDAALIDSVSAYYYIMSSGESFYILPESLGEEEYAIGFRKGDQTLRDRIQEIISEMKADGKLGEISRKWFGSDITIVK